MLLRYSSFILFVLASTLVLGCSGNAPSDGPPAEAPPDRVRATTDDARLALDDAERALVDELRARGGLRVAISDERSIYERAEDGTGDGVHYHLVQALGRLLDLPVTIRPTPWSEFFAVDGVVPAGLATNVADGYRPDLFDDVDFYAAAMTPLPWRERFLRFVPLYPSRLVFVARAGAPPSPDRPLAGRRLALVPNTSYETWVRDTHNLDGVTIVEAATGEEQLSLVADGVADIAVGDANLVLAQLVRFPGLEMTPSSAPLDTLAWAVPRDDERLYRLLARAVDHLLEAGTLDEIWRDYYGTPLVDYLSLLTADE